MNAQDRTRLTLALREHVGRIAADLRAQMRDDAEVRERAKQLHRDEQVGENFDVWTDLLSRRAAVLWVLKSVYVRVLEDRGLLKPGRLLDPEAQTLFEHLAPNLGETAFLRWIYRDLASHKGGLPELFSVQPAEVGLPADALSRDLISFWRHRNPDTGAHWSFAEEKFEGELMGDLYQELDPVVKDRFALCQTPDFIRSFILDRTLTPAIEEFGADTVRLLDPACGSGHFLIDGLKRLVEATAGVHGDWALEKVVRHSLERVVGIDLNDYACALARARLVMTAAELAGVECLAEAAQFHPQVYCADGLDQVEREIPEHTELLENLAQNVPTGALTRPEVRLTLSRVLKPCFNAVVGNPPYINEKDSARRAYHREKIDAKQRYISAYKKYSLSCPFTERCFQLATSDAFIGLITSNNFMKREFGRALIENVLANIDLTLVVDVSQAHIPHHDTPPVIFFARNRPPEEDSVIAVMGKRGSPETSCDPSRGHVWRSIVEGCAQLGFENEYVTVASLSRRLFKKHPWSLGGGGAVELKQHLESHCRAKLDDVLDLIGVLGMTNADEVMLTDQKSLARARVEPEFTRPILLADKIRNWSASTDSFVLFPYASDGELTDITQTNGLLRWLWPTRTTLGNRATFSQGTYFSEGLPWWKWHQIALERLCTPLSITYAEIATHNHFVLDLGTNVFKQTAPILKLPAGSTKEAHLELLGLLNSSTASFWMKQVCFCKGASDGRKASEAWQHRYAHDGTKLRALPLPAGVGRCLQFATQIDVLARKRQDQVPHNLLARTYSWNDATTLRGILLSRHTADLKLLLQMISFQEELDWLCYELYGLLDDAFVVPPNAADPMPPTWLPYLLNLATAEEEVRAALAAGVATGETPTTWFEHHRWEPITQLPNDVQPALRERIEKRRQIIAQNPNIALIEKPTFKRRWYNPDYEAEEKAALELWLADAVEAAAEKRTKAFTLEQLCVDLQDDARVLAVAEVLTNRRDFSLTQLVQQVLDKDSVPLHPYHIYKESGLAKRAAWEKTWEDQRREDAGEQVTPEVPPTYTSADFLRNEYWQLRGKLDVPKERFIAFTEVPNRTPATTLYGWAGWTPLQRLKALLAIDEDLEDQGTPLESRIGLLDSAWRLLPWVTTDDSTAANSLKAELQSLVGPDGPAPPSVAEWRPGLHTSTHSRRRRPDSAPQHFKNDW